MADPTANETVSPTTNETVSPTGTAELTRLHYRADRPDAYADALLRLVRLARTGTDDFSFGPVSLVDCERDGLQLAGPDLSAPIAVLAGVPGLAQIDPQVDAQIDTSREENPAR